MKNIRRAITWLAIVLVLILADPAAGFGSDLKFSLNLYGGLNYLSGGDLNKGLQGMNDYDGRFFWYYGLSHVSGEYEPVHMGMNFGGDFILQITPALGIGLGAGYLQGKSESHITYGPVDAGDDTTARVQAVPIRLTVYYTVPTGSLLAVRFHAGLAYYLAKMSYDWRSHAALSWNLAQADTSGGGFGVHGGLGFEFNVSPAFTLFLEGQGRYANLGGFEGSLTLSGPGGSFESANGTVYYYVVNLPPLGSFPAITPLNSEPSIPAISQAREAKIDFSGFSIVAGVLIRF